MKKIFKISNLTYLFKNFTKHHNAFSLNQTSFYTFSKKKDSKNDKQPIEASKTEKQLDFALLEKNFQEIQELFKQELLKVKRGRISPESFSHLQFNIDGQKSLVQFVPKSANSISLNVYDESNVDIIIKMLENQNMGLQLRKEGKFINCLQMDGNTQEMKNETLKQVKKIYENNLQKLRQRRSLEIDNLKSKKDHAMKDLIFQAEKQTQTMYVKFSENFEKILKTKEKEIQNS